MMSGPTAALVFAAVLAVNLSLVVPQMEDPFLVYGGYHDVNKLDLNGTNTTILVPSAAHAHELDYDIKQGYLYWHDFNAIFRANLTDGSGVTTLFQPNGSDYLAGGLALDWANNRIYFSKMTNSSGTISIYFLANGTEQEVIVSDYNYINGIAVDPINEWIYWTHFQGIERSTMDGENRTIIYNDTTRDGIFFLTLDHINQRLYWTAHLPNTNEHSVESSSVDGTGLVIHTQSATYDYFYGVAYFDGNIYYCTESVLAKLAFDGTHTILTNDSGCYGIEVVALSARPISDTDECSLGTAECDINAMCTNTDDSYTCTCLPGYTGDGMSCSQMYVEYPGVTASPDDSSQECLSEHQRARILNEISMNITALIRDRIMN